MERILALSFENPDGHLDTIETCRPGQGGMLLRKLHLEQAKELAEQEAQSMGAG